MAAKLIVLAVALGVCHAGPIWINGDKFTPGAMVVRIGHAPDMAFGFGSGFSTNIGGISHSTSMGSSFQSGDAEAYGSGVAATKNGAYARGIGIANAAPIIYTYPLGYQHSAASAYNHGLVRNAYGSAPPRNYDGLFGSAVSSAQTQNGLQYSSALSTAPNGGLRGLGYESSIATASSNGVGYGTALSSAQSSNGFGDFDAAVSAAQNVDGYEGSTAQAVQHRAGSIQHSGASSINGPGLQAAQSHVVKSGLF